MLLKSPSGLHYPITVTSLLKRVDDEVEKGDGLFAYTYTSTVTEGNKYDDEVKEVSRTFPARFDSEISGKLQRWSLGIGRVIIGPGVPLVEIDEPCKHEVQWGGLCASCGKDMTQVSHLTSVRDSERAPITFAHGQTALTVSERHASRAEDEAKRRLLRSKKLSLVVDLDQTIIHCTVDSTVAEWQKDPNNPNYPAVKDVGAFQLVDDGPGARGCWYYIKSRPGLTEFLENISKFYELHIYTMGTRAYAQNVAKLVDPDRRIFGDRILSRDESGSMTAKNLGRLFPVDTKMVVIIDDRGDVWQWSPNLIKVTAFDFFRGAGDINSSFLPSRYDLGTQGTETDGVVPHDEATAIQSSAASAASEALISSGESAANGEFTDLEKKLIEMGGGANPELLKEQSIKQDEVIAAQISNKPLAQNQMLLDKQDEEAEDNDSMEIEDGLDHPRNRHALLQDNDDELPFLQTCLTRVHQAFYDDYERKLSGSQGGRVAQLRGLKGAKKRPVDDLRLVPDIKDIMPKIKRTVLKGTSIVFSGVIPQGIDPQMSDWGMWACSFGAEVTLDVSKRTTHVIANKERRYTKKVKKAAQYPHICIVTTDWLSSSLVRWERVEEKPYLIPIDLNEAGVHHPVENNSTVIEEPDGAPWLSAEDEDPTTTDAEGTEPEVEEEEASEQNTAELMNLLSTFKQAYNDDTDDDWPSDSSDDSTGTRASESEGDKSTTSNRSSSSKDRKKRKRESDSADASEAEESDASGNGSMLQKKKKRAFERVSSLTNVVSADKSSGLPSPDTTGPDEDQGNDGVGLENGDFGGSDDDLEAELWAELEKDD